MGSVFPSHAFPDSVSVPQTKNLTFTSRHRKTSRSPDFHSLPAGCLCLEKACQKWRKIHHTHRLTLPRWEKDPSMQVSISYPSLRMSKHLLHNHIVHHQLLLEEMEKQTRELKQLETPSSLLKVDWSQPRRMIRTIPRRGREQRYQERAMNAGARRCVAFLR